MISGSMRAKKSRPGQGRLRMGLVKNSSGCGREELFTSGEEWAKFWPLAHFQKDASDWLRNNWNNRGAARILISVPHPVIHHYPLPELELGRIQKTCVWSVVFITATEGPETSLLTTTSRPFCRSQ